MKMLQKRLDALDGRSRWFLSRGLWLACLMGGAALTVGLALLRSGGWDVGEGQAWAAFFRDSGLVTLLTAPAGCLLLEHTFRELK